MKLCILGVEPLETLEEWARELFSEIPNKNFSVSEEYSAVPPFVDTELRKYVYSIPVKVTTQQ